MTILGITGGIGMGKSTAASLLVEQGLTVIDTDTIARQIVEPGQEALSEIQRSFGSDLIDSTGHLRRAELANRVFSDPAARQLLESILHPRIRRVWLDQVARWRTEERPLAAVVIPLLFETDAAQEFTSVICLACSEATQQLRLRARGWTNMQMSQRNLAQWPIEKKMAKAGFVVWTEGSLQTHAEQWTLILKQVKLAASAQRQGSDSE